MNRSQGTDSLDSLTPREIDVLLLLSEGLTNQEIADRLTLSLGTVKWYTIQIYAKLGVHSRTKAIAYARQLEQTERQITAVPTSHLFYLFAQPTSFVGRTQELSEIIGYLLSPNCRLLTLVGAPGIGKTRLSLHTATALESEFRDGVHFVPLSAIRDSGYVASAICGALGVPDERNEPVIEVLKRYLQLRDVLLILDNFEQVLDAASMLTELLNIAPGLKLLVTSREALRLYGEQEYCVPTLSIPDLSRFQGVDSLRQNASVMLFVQRASAVRRDFQLTEENARTIAQICVQLDGLPLAIELAAARLKLFTPAALLNHLGARLSLLTDGPRNAPHRHKTLRNALDWSYSLLHSMEQEVFACLGIFVGGWSLEAAQAVCQQVVSKGIDIIDMLATLLHKSLIVLADASGDDARFMMLETLREYALEKLAESGRLGAAQAAHAGYYLSLAEQSEEARYSIEQVRWIDRLTADYRNILAAIDHYHERTDGAEAELRMMDTLGWYWQLSSDYREGYRRVHAALARDGENLSARSRISGYFGAARMERAAGNYARAAEFYEQMLALARTVGDERGMIQALVGLAITVHLLHDLHRARQINDEAIAICNRTGNKMLLGPLYNNQANILIELGETAQAQIMYEQAHAFALRRQQVAGMDNILNNLGRLSLHFGEYTRAVNYFEESAAYATRVGNRSIMGFSLLGLANAFLEECCFSKAQDYINEGLAITNELNRADLRVESMMVQARLSYALGNQDQAEIQAREALKIEPTLDTLVRAQVLELLARLLAKNGQTVRAVRILGSLESTRVRVQALMSRSEIVDYTQTINDLRQTLGDTAFMTVWAEGMATSLKEVIAYAL